MRELKYFLESSSIAGVPHIASTRKFARIFWIFVVFGGFTGAFILIQSSFANWNQSPISTTIETLPISEITFPNVTVCPPKNSLLNLNHDIMKSEEIDIDMEKRTELFEHALEIIQDEFFKEMMANLSKLEDPDRFYNWYHGYTDIKLPYFSKTMNRLVYYIYTSAISGNISTQYFREKFDIDKMDEDIFMKIAMGIPKREYLYLKDDKNSFFFSYVDKYTIKEVGDTDRVSMNGRIITKEKKSQNVTGRYIEDEYSFILSRKVSKEDLNLIKSTQMPGFRLLWKWSSNKDLYKTRNKQFIR